MIRQERGEFNGLACRWLSNGRIRLAVTTGRGPRVVFCGLEGGRNLFAETPDVALDGPYGSLHLLGGHRLWSAPEIVERTYWPDDRPIKLGEMVDGARFIAEPDGGGIVKELTLTLAADEARVTVTHTLRNTGEAAIELAAWALTMVPLGGVALLPQPQGPVDPRALLPNRFMTLWPYSDPTDSRLTWGNRIILMRGEPAPPNKLGYRNAHGWVAHWLDGTLFTKEFAPHLDGAHPDNGCNTECYVNDQFMEVESLGPLVTVGPGQAVEHEELWRLHGGVGPIGDEGAAVAVARTVGLR
ncbi:MAG: hypothetical protein AVDCRST_MAG18-875 [uncultured Thermomicrobiales bacterium]|uniref:Uncharacterized protein n=1 Tax=uncultured Thermomicrobiales bacterium TaxID=1645740 RepID=A0A6J4UUD4_9BACT|nr:MAG: hypothetical protein AVDCRST_MAG18-875 [uncultured Thermomicrobiales bacterium]